MIRQDGKAHHGNQTAVLRDQSQVTLLIGGRQRKEERGKICVVMMDLSKVFTSSHRT